MLMADDGCVLMEEKRWESESRIGMVVMMANNVGEAQEAAEQVKVHGMSRFYNSLRRH